MREVLTIRDENRRRRQSFTIDFRSVGCTHRECPMHVGVRTSLGADLADDKEMMGKVIGTDESYRCILAAVLGR